MSYFGRKPATIARTTGVLSGFSDFLSSVVGGVKNVTTGALDYYGKQKQTEGQVQALTAGQAAAAPVTAGGGMPSWLLPVGLVGGAVAIAVVLKKRKK